jgi:hypothetical protein
VSSDNGAGLRSALERAVAQVFDVIYLDMLAAVNSPEKRTDDDGQHPGTVGRQGAVGSPVGA